MKYEGKNYYELKNELKYADSEEGNIAYDDFLCSKHLVDCDECLTLYNEDKLIWIDENNKKLDNNDTDEMVAVICPSCFKHKIKEHQLTKEDLNE